MVKGARAFDFFFVTLRLPFRSATFLASLLDFIKRNNEYRF